MASFSLVTGKPSSRNIADLHPEMQRRCNALFRLFKETYPSDPQPIADCTYRNAVDQNADFAKGRTAPGPKVTAARFTQSLHNYFPALAFDVYFIENGKADWDESLFAKLGSLAAQCDLEWGACFHDNPHFQPRNNGLEYHWQFAQRGIEPVWRETPALSPEASPAQQEAA